MHFVERGMPRVEQWAFPMQKQTNKLWLQMSKSERSCRCVPSSISLLFFLFGLGNGFVIFTTVSPRVCVTSEYQPASYIYYRKLPPPVSPRTLPPCFLTDEIETRKATRSNSTEPIARTALHANVLTQSSTHCAVLGS